MTSEPSDALKEAVAKQDHSLARSCLSYMLDKDPQDSRGQARAALDYVIDQIPDFLENPDPDLELNPDPSAWDEDYWFGVKSELMRNFTRERFGHLIEAAAVAFSKKPAAAPPACSAPKPKSAPTPAQPEMTPAAAETKGRQPPSHPTSGRAPTAQAPTDEKELPVSAGTAVAIAAGVGVAVYVIYRIVKAL